MRTPEERKTGLAQKGLKLGPNDTMLFIFEQPTSSTFWNQGVPYPIDVAFFDQDKLLIYVGQMQAQQTQALGCLNGNYSYVLETNAGWFQKNKIQPGTPLDQLINNRR